MQAAPAPQRHTPPLQASPVEPHSPASQQPDDGMHPVPQDFCPKGQTQAPAVQVLPVGQSAWVRQPQVQADQKPWPEQSAPVPGTTQAGPKLEAAQPPQVMPQAMGVSQWQQVLPPRVLQAPLPQKECRSQVEPPQASAWLSVPKPGSAPGTGVWEVQPARATRAKAESSPRPVPKAGYRAGRWSMVPPRGRPGVAPWYAGTGARDRDKTKPRDQERSRGFGSSDEPGAT